jgi:predicted enzyme related to lactoylglutathione lyase
MNEQTGCRVVEINIGARNLGESVRFYSDAFGLRFDEDKHGDGPVHFHAQFGRWPSEQFFLLNINEDRDPGSMWSTDFGFLVDDLEAVHQRAIRAGADEVFAPEDVQGMPRSSTVNDPSGNTINLYQG